MTKTLHKNPSAAYKAVIQAARDLAIAEGEEMAQRALAEAMIEYNQKAFISREKVRQKDGTHVCTDRLQGAQRCKGSRSTTYCDSPYGLPGADHLTEWVQAENGQTIAITSQPYGLSYKHLREIVKYCKQHNLEAEIDAGSWWFPCRTIVLIYKRADTEKAGQHCPGDRP